MTPSLWMQLGAASLTAVVLFVLIVITFQWWLQTVRNLRNEPQRVRVIARPQPMERRSRRHR